MHDEMQVPQPADSANQEAFLGSFSRVPNGLDPIEVYSYFLKVSARIQQLEEASRRVSAPFILEAALREASEVRTQAAQASERAYNEIVRAGQEEAERIRAEAEQQARQIVQDARATVDDVQRQADEVLARARDEAANIRRAAEAENEQVEQELERICLDFAAFLQRLLDRRRSDSRTGASADGEQPVPITANGAGELLAGATASVWPASPVGDSEQAAPEAATGDETSTATASDGQSTAPATEEQPEKRGEFRLPSWLDS